MSEGGRAPSHWRVQSGVQLGPSWDDGSAIFLANTAQTLALSPFASVVLEELMRCASGADANELIATLITDANLDQSERQDLAGSLAQVLDDFAAFGVSPHSVGPRFPGPRLIRTRCPDTSPNSTL